MALLYYDAYNGTATTCELGINGRKRPVCDMFLYEKKATMFTEEILIKVWGEGRSGLGSGRLNKNGLYTVSMNIPDPKLRRSVNMDGEFFAVGGVRNLSLYMPYRFFDFEVSDACVTTGYEHTYYKQYQSNNIRVMNFIDYTNPLRTVEDEDLISEAVSLTHRKLKIEKEYSTIYNRLNELDPDQKLEKLYKHTAKRMLQNKESEDKRRVSA